MFEAKEDVLNGLWDGPCNSEDPPTWDDDQKFATVPHTPATPANYPGCGCDCANLLRRDLATCTENSCTNVAQQYALPGSKCEGSDVEWDLSASSDNCADNLYGDGSFDSTWGDACLDDDGNVQAASETCYQTLASNDEAALTDKKSNIGQCAFNLDCPAGSFFNLETCEDCDALDGDCADCECRDFDQVVEANCKAACAAPTCPGQTACDWDGSPCAADEFCNFDGGNVGSCEKCSDEDHCDRGLPSEGEADCKACCGLKEESNRDDVMTLIIIIVCSVAGVCCLLALGTAAAFGAFGSCACFAKKKKTRVPGPSEPPLAHATVMAEAPPAMSPRSLAKTQEHIRRTAALMAEAPPSPGPPPLAPIKATETLAPEMP